MKTWYHGTTADDADFIIRNGINCTMGLPKKDFSDGNGFYIQDDLKSAIKWPRVRAGGEEVLTAVLIYQFTTRDLETMNWENQTHLQRQPVFNNSDLNAWTRIVQFYR